VASRFQPFSVEELRGLDENENPHGLATGSLSLAENVWRMGRSVGTRPGIVRDPDGDYADSVGGGATIVGIVDFRRNRDANRDLVVVIPGAIHIDVATTLDIASNAVDITNAAELPWTFVQHKNVLYAAGGDVGVSDQAWYWDPTIGAGDEVTPLGILNNAGVAAEPRYLCKFGNRLFAAGFNGTDPSANPGIVRYSALNDGKTWPTENTIGGNNSVGGLSADDEEYITGLSTYQNNEGRWLLVLTNRRVYSFQESPNPAQIFIRVDELAVGCVGQPAYVNLGVDASDAVFVSDEGVHSLMETQREGNYSRRRYLSWMIRKTFATVNRTRLRYIVGAPWPEFGLAIFSVPTGSALENDKLLVLDLKDTAGSLNADNAIWYPWLTDGNLSYLAYGRTADGIPRLYWGDYNGNVGIFTTATYSDLGVAYTAKFRTKYTDFNAATATKTLGDLYVDVGRPTSSTDYSILCQPVFDWGRKPGEAFSLQLTEAGSFILDVSLLDVGVLGDSESVYHFKLYGTGSCYTGGFYFAHTGVNEPFYVHRIAGEVSVAGESSSDEEAA
jgi:hypothetical protein